MTNLTSSRVVGAALLGAVKRAPAGIGWLSSRVVGNWEWQPPSWLAWVGALLSRGWRYLVTDFWRLAVVLLVLASAIGGWVWYKSRPVPHYARYTVNAPGLTEYGDTGISSSKALTVLFSRSAAPLQQVDKTIGQWMRRSKFCLCGRVFSRLV
jgi:hypothetical protein